MRFEKDPFFDDAAEVGEGGIGFDLGIGRGAPAARFNSAADYLCPIDYYRGDPARLHAERRAKLTVARHQRREATLQLRQPTLPLVDLESVANCEC